MTVTNIEHTIPKDSSKLYIWTLKGEQYGVSAGSIVRISSDDDFPVAGVPLTSGDEVSLCIFEAGTNKHVVNFTAVAEDNDTKYSISFNADERKITLTGSDTNTSEITLPAGSGDFNTDVKNIIDAYMDTSKIRNLMYPAPIILQLPTPSNFSVSYSGVGGDYTRDSIGASLEIPDLSTYNLSDTVRVSVSFVFFGVNASGGMDYKIAGVSAEGNVNDGVYRVTDNARSSSGSLYPTYISKVNNKYIARIDYSRSRHWAYSPVNIGVVDGRNGVGTGQIKLMKAAAFISAGVSKDNLDTNVSVAATPTEPSVDISNPLVPIVTYSKWATPWTTVKTFNFSQ